MLFGIVANRRRPGAEDVVLRTLHWITEHGHDYQLCVDLKDLTDNPAKAVALEKLAQYCDCVISMGGDGTLLSTSRAIGASNTPILGINLGSLGFLTQVSVEHLEESLEWIVAGKHQIEKRMMLEIRVSGQPENASNVALNDVVIDRGSVARLIELNLFVNDKFICTYRADGLILCTPTGSTAYNAAVGGPILNPTMTAIVASPMAPQSLAARPLLFDGDVHIKIRFASRHHSGIMTIDGQVSVPLKSDDEITVQRAAHVTSLITFPQHSFYEILRSKLHWGVLPYP